MPSTTRRPDSKKRVPCDICRGVYWGVDLAGRVIPCPHCGHVGGPRLPPDYNHGAGWDRKGDERPLDELAREGEAARILGNPPCPICKRGVLLEWRAGFYCSNRYAQEDRCDFEGGWCNSPEEFQRTIRRYREEHMLMEQRDLPFTAPAQESDSGTAEESDTRQHRSPRSPRSAKASSQSRAGLRRG